MAKIPKCPPSRGPNKRPRASKRKSADSDLDWLNLTDEQVFQRILADIRQQLKTAIAPYVDGPFEEPADGRFWLNLSAGGQWYRPKDSLTANQTGKLNLLKLAANNAILGEQEYYGPDLFKSMLFKVGLQIGILLERAKVVISTDNLGGGRPLSLTNDQIIQVRIAHAKGRPVKTLAKDCYVSEDTIYRALKVNSQK